MVRPTVMLRRCATYDPTIIQGLVRDGLDHLGLRPFGRTLVKPNIVAAGPRFPHAYTRPEFMEGVVRALQERARPDLEEIAVGERSGITMPTRFTFAEAGYDALARRLPGLKLYRFDEEQQVEVPMFHPARLRDALFTPEPVARADFFVNCPKFKAHPWTTVTFSMKNYIGIQDDRHRLIDHDHKLDEKVADLQYVVQPQFIAIDGIIAGEGRMLTPIPFDLQLVAMGNNQVAFDAVCCHIIGVDPLSVAHIRFAYERGFGPVDLNAIDIVGDLTLAQAQDRARGFRVGRLRVEEYFQGTNIVAHAGPPPSDTTDYCWGGCPGAMEEAIEIMRLFGPGTDAKLPRTHLLFGAYEGPVDAAPGEKVVLIGDCATYRGSVHGREVSLSSLYIDRSKKDPHAARDEDIFAKILKTNVRMWQARKDDVFRLAGCPVSVAEQVLLLVKLGKLKNPYFDMSQAWSFTNAYFRKKTHDAIQRILGIPYQTARGALPSPRGAARPEQGRSD